jgi:hypothetical protein
MTPADDKNVMLDGHIHDIPGRLVMQVITQDKYQQVKQKLKNFFYWYTICC